MKLDNPSLIYVHVLLNILNNNICDSDLAQYLNIQSNKFHYLYTSNVQH